MHCLNFFTRSRFVLFFVLSLGFLGQNLTHDLVASAVDYITEDTAKRQRTLGQGLSPLDGLEDISCTRKPEKSSERKRRKESSSDSSNKRQRAKEETIRVTRPLNKSLQIPLPSQQKGAASSGPLTTVTASRRFSSSSARAQKSYLEEYNEIMSQTPAVESPLTEIKVADEERGGSRRWVKHFKTLGSETSDKVSKRHQETTETLQQIQQVHKTLFYKYSKRRESKSYLPETSNFLLATLHAIFPDGRTEEISLPYFFVSGWPSNNVFRSGSLKVLSDKIKEKLGEDFVAYQVKALTTTDSEKTEDRRWDGFKEDLRDLFSKEVEKDKAILEGKRVQAHQRLIEHSTHFPYFYFHSEQALRRVVHDKIAYFKRGRLSLSGLTFVLDITSYFDMCWFCSDTLSRCGVLKTDHQECPMVIRCSSIQSYADQPFIKQPGGALQKPYYLRTHRDEFTGYETGKAWVLDGEGFRPYTAQATVEDFKDS